MLIRAVSSGVAGWAGPIRLGFRIRRPAAGKLLLQPLVDTGLGKLGRHADTVVDGAVIRGAVIHDANAAQAQQRRAAVLGIVEALLEVVERLARQQRAYLRGDGGVQRLAQQSRTKRASPSDVFSATLPTKPSQTTTSALPL